MKPRDAIPPDWTARLAPGLPTALGHDVGTTARGTSNPSALAVAQLAAPRVSFRFILAWKTADDAVSHAILRMVVADILAAGIQPRGLAIDASSEKFFASAVRRNLAGLCPVRLVSGNQKLDHRGEQLDAKTLLGNLYSNALEDGRAELPPGDWIAADHRLVKREAGGFVTETGKGGEHGDTFDACKLAHWLLAGRIGSARGVSAVRVGEFNAGTVARPGIRNKHWLRDRARRALTS